MCYSSLINYVPFAFCEFNCVARWNEGVVVARVQILMTLCDPNICRGQCSSITTLRVRGSQVSGFADRRFAATRTKVHKIIVPGYWLGNSNQVLINNNNSGSTVIYTLIIQLVKVVQQLITTILTSKLAHYSLLSKTFVFL